MNVDVCTYTAWQEDERKKQGALQNVQELADYIRNVCRKYMLSLVSEIENDWICTCVPKIKAHDTTFYRDVSRALREAMSLILLSGTRDDDGDGNEGGEDKQKSEESEEESNDVLDTIVSYVWDFGVLQLFSSLMRSNEHCDQGIIKALTMKDDRHSCCALHPAIAHYISRDAVFRPLTLYV